MIPNVYQTPFIHVRNIITKIILLTRIFTAAGGDIVLYSKSYAVQLVAFIAAYASNKTLHILSATSEIGNIVMDRRVSIILLDTSSQFAIEYVSKNSKLATHLELIAAINPNELLNIRENFDFIVPRAINIRFQAELNGLLDSSFKDETEFFKEYNKPRVGDIPLLTVNNEGQRIAYTRSSIWETMHAIDSEFGTESEGIVSLRNTSFKETFAYALYFFLKGDVLDVLSHESYFDSFQLANSKLKHKMFVSGDHFAKEWHNIAKFVFFNRINRFLRRWKLTRWLTTISYTRTFKRYMTTSKDEYVIVNYSGARTSLEFLRRVRAKVSFIFGTYADAYTLSINRYDEKKVKIQDRKYRVMGKDIHVELNTINQLFLGGKRIPASLRTKIPVNVKDRNDRYHLTEYYCEVENEIITVRASSEDLYFEDEGSAIIDVGTKRRSLMEVPFIKRVDVLKHGVQFKCVVELDKAFIKAHFENPTLSDVKARLREKIKEMNYKDHSQHGMIGKLVVLDKFFNEYEAMSHLISKKNYVKLLNQRASNLGGPGSG